MLLPSSLTDPDPDPDLKPHMQLAGTLAIPSHTESLAFLVRPVSHTWTLQGRKRDTRSAHDSHAGPHSPFNMTTVKSM